MITHGLNRVVPPGRPKLDDRFVGYLQNDELGYRSWAAFGPVRQPRLADGKVKCYTVCREPTGRYYLSLQVAVKAPQSLPKTGKIVGIDVGITDLAVSSNGIKYGTYNANWYEKQAITWQRKYSKRRHQATIAVRQWNHNHKTMKTELDDYQNWQRARQQNARHQAKIAGQRKDYLHKLTMALVKQYDVIVIEDLKIKNLQKNHCLAKSIVNASWYQFRTMLAYKCAWCGKCLVVIKPNYTSQICSHCGYHSGHKPLNIREWTCPNCGTHHNRDINVVHTRKSNVERMFFNDVLDCFNKNDFGGLPTSLRGQSGVKYGFRYAIPKRGHNPLRLIDIQNSISTNQVMLNAFKFGDIKSNHTFHYYL